jgi:TolB-like protein
MHWKNYWQELQRRHVVKAGIAYLVLAWLITQVLSILIPVFEIPNSILKTTITVMAIGFPIWLVFAWVYDFTPQGLKKTDQVEYDAVNHAKKNIRLNRVIIGGLLIAVILLVVNQVRMKGEMTVIKAAATTSTFESSIAVMAFTDMSPKKDHEYFSDGISEELLNLLAKIPELKVISRSSSFSFKSKNITATEIGNELNVSYMLEGSVRKDGNTVRITAQLINTDDGSQVWSQTFDRDLDSIFKIQDEIAKEVSDQLQLSLLGTLDQQASPETEAYNLYLQSKHLYRQNTKESFIKAKELIEQSIAVDSTYSNSWDLLASIYDSGYYNFSIGDAQESIVKGLESIEKAIELDPNSAYAYATRSSLYERSWNFDKSANDMEKALELKPNDAIIIGTAALYTFGDLKKTVELLNKAIRLDPLVYANHYNLGNAKYKLGLLDEALKSYNTFELYYPNSQLLHYQKAKVFLAQGKKKEAQVEIEKETNEFFSLYGRNFVYFDKNNKQSTKELFNEFLEKHSEVDPANTADLYAFRGDFNKSFEFLYKALEIKDAVLLEALAYPSFKPMHKDPRWKKLIEDINPPDNHGYPVY